jgi:hypothetical protein
LLGKARPLSQKLLVFFTKTKTLSTSATCTLWKPNVHVAAMKIKRKTKIQVGRARKIQQSEGFFIII